MRESNWGFGIEGMLMMNACMPTAFNYQHKGQKFIEAGPTMIAIVAGLFPLDQMSMRYSCVSQCNLRQA